MDFAFKFSFKNTKETVWTTFTGQMAVVPMNDLHTKENAPGFIYDKQKFSRKCIYWYYQTTKILVLCDQIFFWNVRYCIIIAEYVESSKIKFEIELVYQNNESISDCKSKVYSDCEGFEIVFPVARHVQITN